MIKVGITGQSGFIGGHLYNELGLFPETIIRIPFEDNYFQDGLRLREFVKQCDVIVHLAAMNRHSNPQIIYETNLCLVRQLIVAMESEKCTPCVLFASSIQEERNNEYGNSKREGRELLENWARCNGASFVGLVIPNVYGPFGRPNYNSFIATFCHKLTHNEQPKIVQDSRIGLIYVGNLCKYIIDIIKSIYKSFFPVIERKEVPYDFEKGVTEILDLLSAYKVYYLDQGLIPFLSDQNALNLFNTFRSYIDFTAHFPVKLIKHADSRGVFVETIKLGIGGQVSFSTTLPGIIRGNHYHSRKIERFTVIRGKACIQLRRIGSDEVISFYLDGNEPSYVDIPIWYTHNIENIGEEELYTQFWINEWYNPADGDTYFEKI